MARVLGAVCLLVLAAAALTACHDETATETSRLLSVNSPGKDEDPSLIRALDGSLWMAWFSERNGNSDIYLTHSTDAGESWGPAVRLTTDPGGDFAPSLMQDATGRFHIAWFRWTALNRGHIYYNSSADGVTWNAAGEELVTTTDSVDDWVPSITQRADGTLLVYFVSDLRNATPGSDIYVSAKPVGGVWGAATVPAGINSNTLNDHLPFVLRTGANFTMVWDRNSAAALPWQSPAADLFMAFSTDGLTWTGAGKLTIDPANTVNVFPQLYADQSGAFQVLWLSGNSATQQTEVKQLALTSLATYPLDVLVFSGLPAGYSYRIAPTSVPGRSVIAWVQGPDGSQDIYYTFVNR